MFPPLEHARQGLGGWHSASPHVRGEASLALAPLLLIDDDDKKI